MGYFKKLTVQKAGFIAGVSLLIMTVIAIAVFSSLEASLFSIIGIFVIFVLDIIVALTLYILLVDAANKNLSLTMAILRIIYSGVLLLALININNLDTFYLIWDFGLLIFGSHLLLLGYLVFKSYYIPKILGILVMLASIGYIVDSIGKFFGYSLEIAMYTFFGELFFAIWLVFKARNIKLNLTSKSRRS